jgi:hypothetical protein
MEMAFHAKEKNTQAKAGNRMSSLFPKEAVWRLSHGSLFLLKCTANPVLQRDFVIRVAVFVPHGGADRLKEYGESEKTVLNEKMCLNKV